MKDIIRQTSNTLVEKLFGQVNSKKMSTIVKTITDTRNYHTHRDSKEKYPMAIDNKVILDSYIKKLNVILQYWILKGIGIDPSIIEKRISEFSKNHSAFSDVIDQ